MANPTHTCERTCWACNRPSDTFRHIHIPAAKENDTAGEVIFCVPCLSNLMSAVYPMIQAYLSGGKMFDDYGKSRQRGTLHPTGTPMPTWVMEVLKELEAADETPTDDPRD